MAPLDLLNENQEFKDKNKIVSWLKKCQQGGIDGIMVDVWWGLTETSPKTYKFTGYIEFFNLCKQYGLKIVPVLSFHKCGDNVGDANYVPLPKFITSSPQSPFFMDMNGNVDDEYISFGFDNVAIRGRTPLQMYEDYMNAFKQAFSSFIQNKVISEIEVGLGPCGELRYPSYRQATHWSYPGCGTFQAFDSQMKSLLASMGSTAPTVNQNDTPLNQAYWQAGRNGFDSNAGRQFAWNYHQILVDHGSAVLSRARKVFGTTRLSAKIAGLHWWYNTPAHCIETTGGFYNYLDYDGYRDILKVFKNNNVHLCFTCLELTGDDQYKSDPPALVKQLINGAKSAGIDFEGENALPCYDPSSFGRIKAWVSQGLKVFTYLRLDDNLVKSENWNNLLNFVKQMHS